MYCLDFVNSTTLYCTDLSKKLKYPYLTITRREFLASISSFSKGICLEIVRIDENMGIFSQTKI